jgi:surface antigen
MLDGRGNGKGVLPHCAGWRGGAERRDRRKFGRKPGLSRLNRLARRSAAGWQVSAMIIAGGAVPALAGGEGSYRAPSVIVCAGYSACDSRGDTSHRYAGHADASYWRMTAGNECTNYVAYVEATAFRAPTPQYLLGNAGQWPSTAAAHGIVVNHVPSVGAVAEWDGGAPGMGSMGHVAVVEKVGPRSRYILISQQHIGSDPNGYDWTRINAGFPSAQWQEWPDHFIHFAAVADGATAGYYNPRVGTYRLQTSMTGASAAISFRRGEPGGVPLAGDWAGRGHEGTGYYSPRNAWFHLRNRLGRGPSTKAFVFGPPGMVPLAGNWDGAGGAGIGYYDPATGTFHLRDYLSSGRAEYTFKFGPPGMVPLAGDWTGSRRTGIGYYNPATGWFHLREHLSAGRARFVFKFGPRGMQPIVGNWTGGRGDQIGFYNPGSGWFHLRDHLSAGPASDVFKFGPKGMIPLVGDWTGGS